MKKFIITILMLLGASQLVAMPEGGSEQQKLEHSVKVYMSTQNYKAVSLLADALSLRAYDLAQSGDDEHYKSYLSNMRIITNAFVRANAQQDNALQKTFDFVNAYSNIVRVFCTYAQKLQQKPYKDELFKQTLVLKKFHLTIVLLPQATYDKLDENGKAQYNKKLSQIRIDILQTLYALHRYQDIIDLWNNDRQIYESIGSTFKETYFIIGGSYFKQGRYSEALVPLERAFLYSQEYVKPLLGFLVSTLQERNLLVAFEQALNTGELDSAFKEFMVERCTQQSMVLRASARDRVRRGRAIKDSSLPNDNMEVN